MTMTRYGHHKMTTPAPPCSSGKRAYRRRKDARKTLKRAQAWIDVKAIYRCHECGWHHLTSRR